MNEALAKNLIQRVALGDIFRRRAATSPDSTAVVEKRDNEYIQLTYKELNAKLNRFVNMARELGLEKGDRIALLGPNSIEYIVCFYGCAKGGFVAVPINPGLKPDDINYIVEHADVEAFVIDNALFPVAMKVVDHALKIKALVSFSINNEPTQEPFQDFNQLMDRQSDLEIEDVIIQDRDLFEILYTSGTTADPKGVMISHLSIFILSLTNSIELDWKRKTVLLSALPVFHCAQQTYNTTAFHLGGKVVLFRVFEPVEVIQAIEREKIQALFCLPAMYRAMLDSPAIKNADVSSVQSCLYAMTPMDQRTLEESIKTFNADFTLVTGQTECFPTTNVFHSEWQLKKHGNYWGESTLAVDTAVMDDEGNFLPPETEGEIVWRGPGVMKMYLKNDKDTNISRKYAWHHSGDLGYFDKDGLLVFVDRKKDIIKSGGENVASIKVERIILDHPEVKAVAVIGLPHDKWIEAITAFVVPVKNSNLTENDILLLCKEHLGNFEIPKKVVFLDELPKTTTGKLEKYKIRTQFGELYKS